MFFFYLLASCSWKAAGGQRLGLMTIVIVVFANREFEVGLGACCFHAGDSFDEITEHYGEIS